MRTITLAALALSACAPQPALDGAGPAALKDDAAAPTDPFAACDGAKADTLLGKPVDAALTKAAMRLVGAATVRVIAPGMAVTMDYRGNRLNIDTDAANRAVRFHCG